MKHMRNDSTIGFWAEDIGIVVMLALYYFLRHKIAKRWDFTSKRWICSFTAGLIAFFCISLAVNFTVGYGNARWSWTRGELQELNKVASESQSKAREAFKEVNGISDITTKEKIEQAIVTCENAETLRKRAGEDYNSATKYFEEHKDSLSHEEKGMYSDLFGLRGETYRAYDDALMRVNNRLLAVLKYQRDNYDALQRNKGEETGKAESLYSSYNTAVAEYKRAYIRHDEFIQDYLQKHPIIAKWIGKNP